MTRDAHRRDGRTHTPVFHFGAVRRVHLWRRESTVSKPEITQDHLRAIADAVSRRQFLTAVGLGAASASLAACGVDRMVAPADGLRRGLLPPSGGTTVATLNSALASAPST